MNTRKCKLIPLDNPNFEMKNTNQELIDLFNYKMPVISTDMTYYCNNGMSIEPTENMIGYVDCESNITISDGWIYGNIVFFKDDDNYGWKNAIGKVENNKFVTIDAIQY